MSRILFICTGNTCRSPMAEALLNDRSNGKIDARSAGLFATPGYPANEHTIQTLKEEGISIDHASKPLTTELVDWANVILTMTQQHKQSILIQYPELADRVFTFKEFVKGESVVGADDFEESYDVTDPYGGHADIYRQTFKELDELITKLLKKLS
ncbi:low molecular weight protein arginine phosphatase [Alkalihalobacillus sp. AL-G]|uniref:low molecular weight protein arginine phosphatase n=1 Tax=Alkalihalobacillus sp. AL-G TaxID=2926399 RepID=UPI0027298D71|nr:low molecular weight protein arginine phosphatase [Alkalihalobacillus sp. AL-G]WLD93174.1 low molecular weight protein arginine phosphatase [Alkalihalobacillus sp. AL-G]